MTKDNLVSTRRKFLLRYADALSQSSNYMLRKAIGCFFEYLIFLLSGGNIYCSNDKAQSDSSLRHFLSDLIQILYLASNLSQGPNQTNAKMSSNFATTTFLVTQLTQESPMDGVAYY
jgi:hypothetical protein